MQKKSQDFSMDDVMRLANSPAGQQLIAMLQQQDNTLLQTASQQANAGDFTQASQTLQKMLSSQEAKNLIKELGG